MGDRVKVFSKGRDTKMKRSTRLGYQSTRPAADGSVVPDETEAGADEVDDDIDFVLDGARAASVASRHARHLTSAAPATTAETDGTERGERTGEGEGRRRDRSWSLADGLRRAVSAPFLPSFSAFSVTFSPHSHSHVANWPPVKTGLVSTQENGGEDDAASLDSDNDNETDHPEVRTTVATGRLLALFGQNHPDLVSKYRNVARLDAAPKQALVAIHLADGLRPLTYADVSISKRGCLSLCSRSLVLISPNIGFFASSITDLELCCNQITLLPPEIGHLKNLTCLNIRNNLIDAVPASISSCTKLRELHCAHNQLTHLPRSIGTLSKLTTLTLAHNASLQELPQELGLCSLLQDLDLANCTSLPWLPIELFRLKTLHRLDTSDCTALLTSAEADARMEDVLHSDTVYSPPTLRELAARVLHRRQCHVPRSLPGHLKAYMSPAGVRACSFCSGPMMECEVVRWRKVPRDGGVLVAREVLCWRHWDTEAQRIVAMFGRPGWTAPVVAPVGVGGVTVMRAKSGLSSGTTSPAGLGRRSRAGSMEVVGGSNTVAGGGGGGRSRTGSNNSLLLGSNYRWRRGTGDEIDEADVTISLSEESGREILPPPLVNRQAIAAAAAAAATKRKSQQDSAFNAGSSKKSGLRVAHSMMSFFA